jgi:hypothetical protein
LGSFFETGGEQIKSMTYKIKRLAKILTVCAGIVVVSVSLGMITAVELTVHYTDGATAAKFSEALILILLVGGIGGFLAAVWRVEAQARRRLRDELSGQPNS